MILHGDCLIELPKLPDNSVDAIVTDPPYELGFMEKVWDATGIAYNVEMWNQCLRVLKPGGHLLAFGGTRTYHRMAVAIEDAGFEIRDMVEWAYASGFPKSLNISKAIDKKAGAEREVIGVNLVSKLKAAAETKRGVSNQRVYRDFNNPQEVGDITAPATEEAKQWDGFGTALKPAHEPICFARKPLSEKTIVNNVLKHGTGAIDIDGCRMPYQSEDDKNYRENNVQYRIANNIPATKSTLSNGVGAFVNANNNGRFPANLIVSDDALNDGKDRSSGWENADNQKGKSIFFGDLAATGNHPDDSGSFSRYFSLNSWFEQKKSEFPDSVQKTFPFLIVPKAAKSEKGGSNHPTMKPLDLMMYLVTLVSKEGDTVLDMFAGSGTTLLAAQILGRKFVGIEKEAEYIEIIKARLEALPPTLF